MDRLYRVGMIQLLLDIAHLVEGRTASTTILPSPWPVPGETWISTFVGPNYITVGIHSGHLYASCMLRRVAP